MKKRIIVPTDFSPTSHNAFLYALALAELYDAKLEVVHVHMGLLDDSNTRIPIRARKSREEALMLELEHFVNHTLENDDARVLTSIKVQPILVQGFTTQSLIEMTKYDDVLMLVMGATGSHNIINRMLGSISSDVAQKAYCPVMLVPKGAKYTKFKNILYASNYESADKYILNKMLRFNERFNATMHFVHVNQLGDKISYKETEQKIFDTLFQGENPRFSFNMMSMSASSVMKGLMKYKDENEIDMMVLVNRQRSFIDSILGQSMTKKIALRSDVPLLVYHISE